MRRPKAHVTIDVFEEEELFKPTKSELYHFEGLKFDVNYYHDTILPTINEKT